MTWYGLVQPTSGDLVSVGTESMFPDGNIDAFTGVYDRVDFGAVAPDFAVNLWNPTTRALIPRPAPILVDRLNDIEAVLLADADWVAVWNALSTVRKTQIRTGFRRVLAFFLGGARFRGESDGIEL